MLALLVKRLVLLRCTKTVTIPRIPDVITSLSEVYLVQPKDVSMERGKSIQERVFFICTLSECDHPILKLSIAPVSVSPKCLPFP